MHTWVPNEKLKQALDSIEKNVKKSSNLVGDWTGDRTIAALVFDNVLPKAEIHEKAYDVWLIVNGSGKFILGGELEEREQIGPGEWLGASIANGEVVEVGPGDIVDIPPGVPHQVDARGGRLETVIVKIKIK